MATELKLRRGTTSEHETFTGAAGEVTIDSDKNVPVVHDGLQAGGYPLAKEFQLPDITALSSLNTDALVDGQAFNRLEFWPGTNVGGVPIKWKADEPTENHNGGTIIDPRRVSVLDPATKTFNGYHTPVAGNTGCFVVSVGGFVLPDWFGAVRDGLNNDTIPIMSAVEYCGQVVNSDSLTVATGTVGLLAGTYRIESNAVGSVAVRRPDAVAIVGQGSGATQILHYGEGTAFKPQDDTGNLSNIRDRGYTLTDEGGQGSCGFHALRMLRGCELNDVVIRRFFDNYRTETTWTMELNNCLMTNSRRSNIRDLGGTAEIFINGGRYDVSADHNIYINSGAAELIFNTGAAQFSSRSGIYVESARTVVLRDVFLEGNCIGSETDYYLYLMGNGDTLSSCTVDVCAINDLQDPNRTGLGAIYVDKFESFTYNERWCRNGAEECPVVGSNVQRLSMKINSAVNLAPAIQNIDGVANKFAEITQLARPKQLYGKDMDSGPSVHIRQRATLLVYAGDGSEAVALGNYGGVPAVQSTSGPLHLQPHTGDLRLGQSSAKIDAGTNTFFGSHRASTQITSSNLAAGASTGYCAVNTNGGARTVDLVNVVKLAGRTVRVGKLSGDSNNLIVSDSGGPTVNGSSSYTMSGPYEHRDFITDGSSWFVS